MTSRERASLLNYRQAINRLNDYVYELTQKQEKLREMHSDQQYRELNPREIARLEARVLRLIELVREYHGWVDHYKRELPADFDLKDAILTIFPLGKVPMTLNKLPVIDSTDSDM